MKNSSRLAMGVILTAIMMYDVCAQERITWEELPSLPDPLGRAGMFAGATGDRLVAAGGANFPSGFPWEGGKKKWHDDIFILEPGADRWERCALKLPAELAYGVSSSYNGRVFLVGGSTATTHRDEVVVLEWKDGALSITDGPRLPRPLANMAGARVGALLVVVGGMETPAGKPLNCCYGLDLDALENGWFELPTWGGEARIFPVTGTANGKLYLFSGEHVRTNEAGANQRHILQDAYHFTPIAHQGKWGGKWHRLGDIPKGMSAGANPAPWVAGKAFLFSGGVDRITALHTDPKNHPGIEGTLLWYYPETDTWQYDAGDERLPGRVTLPTVEWNGYTYYISGEIKPGIRTNRIGGVQSTTEGAAR